VHQVSPSGDALGGFKSRVALAQNEHGLVLVVLGVGGDGVVALDQLGTGELGLLRLPQTRGHQEDAGGGRERVRGTMHFTDTHNQSGLHLGCRTTCNCSPTGAGRSGRSSCPRVSALPGSSRCPRRTGPSARAPSQRSTDTPERCRRTGRSPGSLVSTGGRFCRSAASSSRGAC